MQIQSPALGTRAGLCVNFSQYLILRWVKREDLLVGTSDFSLKSVFDSIPAFDESSKKWRFLRVHLKYETGRIP
jgi:hypothetical protein